jgi:riboflavin kinase/FMN adenylyltransferase
VVVHGDKRGRELGWPTANVELGNYQRPAFGIYAVRVRTEDGREYDGVANIGVRPMFEPPKELLEVVLFDYEGDLYGSTIEVALHYFIRPEMKFDGLDALKAQMEADAARARQLLA